MCVRFVKRNCVSLSMLASVKQFPSKYSSAMPRLHFNMLH